MVGKYACALIFGLSCLTTSLQAKNVALLIGVGDYQSPSINDLNGPPHDVAALRKVLIDRWGFKAGDIYTLVDSQASKRAILNEFERLQERSAPGDEVLIYFSGHGTSARDADAVSAGLPIPHDSGVIIPWDAVNKGAAQQVIDSMIVGRTDVVPRLKQLDQNGRNLLVIYDSCFSGNAVRGLHANKLDSQAKRHITQRYTPLMIDDDEDDGGRDAGVISSPSATYGMTVGRQTPPYPYKSTFFISAASDYEKADDISRSTRYLPTIDGKPHGAFSDALLNVLNGHLAADSNRNGAIEHLELREAIASRLVHNGHTHHPRTLPGAREDNTNLAYRSLFGIGDVPDIPFQTSSYRVRVDGDSRILQSRLKAMPEIELVSEGMANMVILATENGWLLTNGAGDKIGDAGSPTAVEGRVRQMAWFHRLSRRQAGENPFRFELALDQEGRGVTLQKYDFVNFRLRAEKKIWLVILYVDSTGQMATLYPYLHKETAAITARQNKLVPGGDLLQVCDPLGTDLVVAFGFRDRPKFLDQLVGRDGIDTNSDLYRSIEQAMQDNNRVAVATFELHTVPNLKTAKGCL